MRPNISNRTEEEKPEEKEVLVAKELILRSREGFSRMKSIEIDELVALREFCIWEHIWESLLGVEALESICSNGSREASAIQFIEKLGYCKWCGALYIIVTTGVS